MACSGPAVDLGKATGATYEDPCATDASTSADASSPPFDASIPDAWFDAPYIADSGTDAPWAADGAVPDVYVPPPGDSLSVDGMPCWIIDTSGETREWPQWGISVLASCPVLGSVHVRIDSYANIPYPQSCSVATTVRMYLPWGGLSDGGEAGAPSYFEAGYSDGSCTVTSGPTMLTPTRALEYTAVVEDASGIAFGHFIYFRADGLP